MNLSKLAIPLILLLLVSPIAAKEIVIQPGEYNVKQYCQDNETLVVEKYYTNTSGVNETVSKSFIPSRYGCEDGYIVNPADDLNYGWLNVAALLGFTLINFLLYLLLKEHKGLKLLFLFTGIIATFYMLMYVGIIGANFDSAVFLELSELAWIISRVWLVITLFLIAYFIIMFIYNVFGKGGEATPRMKGYEGF